MGRNMTRRKQNQLCAAHAVRSGNVERVSLEDKGRTLLDAIDQKDQTPFGIRKLQHLDVNSVLDPHPDIPWVSELSLLYYAGWRRRDVLINSLVRAGANPCPNKPEVATYLSALSLDAQAHLVKVWARLRCAGRSQTCSCGTCGERCVSAFPCGCLRCDSCLWGELITNRGDAFVCCGMVPSDAPCPKQLDQWPECEWLCAFCGFSNPRLQPACRNCRTAPDGCGLAHVVDEPVDFDAMASRRRFELLQQKQRAAVTGEFLQAAERGDARRIRRLLARGADIEVETDYGQNALMLAEWRGWKEAAHELRQWGATSSAFHFAPDWYNASSCSGVVTELIPAASSHLGRGAFLVDGIPEHFLKALECVFHRLPSRTDRPGAARRNFCDMAGWVSEALSSALAGTPCSTVLPQLRFLDYEHEGGLATHVDLARESDGLRSTHTFCLYLTDTAGGETVLLEAHSDAARILAAVTPKRGRLFVFPHVCPHRANPCKSSKVLLRGDCL